VHRVPEIPENHSATHVPGLFAGGTIIFIWSFTELGVPLMFRVQPRDVGPAFSGNKDIGGNPFPFALVAVLLATTTILYASGKFSSARQPCDDGKGDQPGRPPPAPVGLEAPYAPARSASSPGSPFSRTSE